MKKILSALAIATIGVSSIVATTAFSPINHVKNNLDNSGNIEFSGALNNWDYDAWTGGSGTPQAGLNALKDPDVLADALNGNKNNSYAHLILTVDFSKYAPTWIEFTNKYSKFAFTGSTTIWGDYQRHWYSNHPINNSLSPNNENQQSLLSTIDIPTNGQGGFLDQENVGDGNLPNIDTTGWNDWWRGSGKKKIAQSQAWGGATAISLWHDDTKIYINLAADFRNDHGTYTANGKSEITLNDLVFVKKS